MGYLKSRASLNKGLLALNRSAAPHCLLVLASCYSLLNVSTYHHA
jgi:hypothetical protein